MQRFGIAPVAITRGGVTIHLWCERCGWNAWQDDETTLAELVQRAEEHTEVCR